MSVMVFGTKVILDNSHVYSTLSATRSSRAGLYGSIKYFFCPIQYLEHKFDISPFQTDKVGRQGIHTRLSIEIYITERQAVEYKFFWRLESARALQAHITGKTLANLLS
jgi:hypothetical protein